MPNNVQLSDDMKKLENEICGMKKSNESILSEKNKINSELENVRRELESVKESRDQFELEKDENEIKVLVLEFQNLLIS